MNKPEVLIFSASWCNPCKHYKNTWIPLKEYYGNLKWKYIDIDEDAEMSEKYKIRSVPTTIISNKDGEVIFKKSGPIDKKELENILKDL